MIIDKYKDGGVIWLIPMIEYFPNKGLKHKQLIIGWLKYRLSFIFLSYKYVHIRN